MAAEFDDNRANTGGAVYVNASTVEIAESAFSGNQASGAKRRRRLYCGRGIQVKYRQYLC